MPKTFSDTERTYIKERLLKEAETCLMQFGMRKTTVDELVKRVNIPKGTFYLFYTSKESLFFEVVNKLHDQIQQDLLYGFDKIQGDINETTVTDLIFRFYKQVDSTFLYSFIVSGELDLLMHKIPADIAKAHLEKDDFNMEQLLSLIFGTHTDETVRIFSAALRAIFLMMSHRQEIGDDIFEETIKVILQGTISQLFKRNVL